MKFLSSINQKSTKIGIIVCIIMVFFGGYYYKSKIFHRSWKQNQIFKQHSQVEYDGKKTINFIPFELALSEVSEKKFSEINRMLQNTTILDIQSMFSSGQLKSEELVLYYINRIKKYDTNRLNSVLELNPDALTIAQKLDIKISSGQAIGILHGIPVMLKDNIGTGDKLHTTVGAKALEDARADRDAFLVTKLRQAGAIILGKANLSEWANCMTSDYSNGFSVLGGQTKNPYGQFDVGGSSSGSAVSVAANFVTASVGTETYGSLISPASQNSVVTLKPSLGLISRDKIIQLTDFLDTAGPMARNVTDLSLLLTAIAGIDSNDPKTLEAQPLSDINFSNYLNVNGLKGVRIGIINNPAHYKNEDRKIIKSALTILKQKGAIIVNISTKIKLKKSNINKLLKYGMKEGVNEYLSNIREPIQVKNLKDIIAFNKSNIGNRAPYGQDLLEKVENNTITFAQYMAIGKKNSMVAKNTMHQIFKKTRIDILLSLINNNTGVSTLAGFPVLSVPAGYRKTGEPISIKFIGDYLSEPKLISVAFSFEQARNNRRSPNLK